MDLSEAVAIVGTPEGRERFKAYLASEPFPHYEACPEGPNFLVRIDENGKRTVGRFVEREFVASEPDVRHLADSATDE